MEKQSDTGATPRSPKGALAGGFTRVDPNRHSREPRRLTLLVLALATAIGSAGLAAGGTAGALLGVELAGTEAAAGLPLGLLVVGQAASAVLVSRRTARAGRGRSLAEGYMLGVVGAALVIAALGSSFSALLAGSAVLGAGNTAVFMTRYAAAEAGGENARGRALGAAFFATAMGAVASPGLLGPGGQAARRPARSACRLWRASTESRSSASRSPPCSSFAPRPRPSRTSGAGPDRSAPRGARGTRKMGPPPALAPRPRAPSARLAVSILAATNLVMVAVMAIAPVHLVAHGHGLGPVGVVVAFGGFAALSLAGAVVAATRCSRSRSHAERPQDGPDTRRLPDRGAALVLRPLRERANQGTTGPLRT